MVFKASSIACTTNDLFAVSFQIRYLIQLYFENRNHSVIPAQLVAEAISTLHGLDLRWSGPITPSEMQYVQQYVFARYPQYCNGLVEEDTNKIDHLDNLSIKEASSETLPDEKPIVFAVVFSSTSTKPSCTHRDFLISSRRNLLFKGVSFQSRKSKLGTEPWIIVGYQRRATWFFSCPTTRML